MSEMVERVAQALHDVDPTIYVGDPKMKYYSDAAIAAIKAMREPTGEMTDQGAGCLGDLDVDFAPNSETQRGAKESWQAMIDEALK